MKKLKTNTALKGLLLACGFATSLSLLAEEQPDVSWRMQALWDAGTTPYEYEQKFIEKVSNLTDGHFEIKLFSAGQIVPAAEAFTAVRGGAFQLMKTYDGYEAGKIPSFAFTGSVPFGFEKPEQFEAWFYEKDGLELVREVYGQYGLFYIAPTIYGAEPIHSKFAINSLEDLKGKKGRFVGLASTVMAELGVVTTPISTSEVYQALDKGVIEMADRGDVTANYEAGLAEVAKFILFPGFHQPTTATSYVANQKAYDKLPDAYKSALSTAALEISHELRDFIREQDEISLKKFEEAGVSVTSPSDEMGSQGREIAIGVWHSTAGEDEMAKKILNSQMEEMKSLGLINN